MPTSELQYRDAVGQEIVVGSYIAYAALWSRSATIKFGRVVDLTVRKDQYGYDRETDSHRRHDMPTIRVVTAETGWKGGCHVQNNGKPLTLGFLERLVVLQSIPNQQVTDVLDTAFNTYMEKK